MPGGRSGATAAVTSFGPDDTQHIVTWGLRDAERGTPAVSGALVDEEAETTRTTRNTGTTAARETIGFERAAIDAEGTRSVAEARTAGEGEREPSSVAGRLGAGRRPPGRRGPSTAAEPKGALRRRAERDHPSRISRDGRALHASASPAQRDGSSSPDVGWTRGSCSRGTFARRCTPEPPPLSPRPRVRPGGRGDVATTSWQPSGTGSPHQRFR